MNNTNPPGRASSVAPVLPPAPRRVSSPHQQIPQTQLLSNVRYAVMMTAAGSGYSHWGDIAITRWREDPTCDPWGSYILLRDVESGAAWSAGYQPTGVEPDSYEARLFEDRVEIDRLDGSISTRLEVVISPDDDAEGRRVTITNHDTGPREIELTSYAELVLGSNAADIAHPVFSKMFVETDIANADVGDRGAILATRRRGSPADPAVWAAHLVVVEGELVGEAEFETDRARFLGRGHDVRNAASAMHGRPLSNTAGAVLDPVFSLRRRVRLEAGATAHVTFWTVVAKSRSEVLDLVGKYYDPGAFEHAVTNASALAQAELLRLHVDSDEATLFQRLASHVLYASNALRPSSDTLAQSVGGQSDLWALSISGDLPIVLCRIDDATDLQIVQQLASAQRYWRAKQLSVDLVIINEQPSAHVQGAQDLHAALEAATRAPQSAPPATGHAAETAAQGKIYILRSAQLSPAAQSLLLGVSRAVFLSRRGSLAEQ
ncbi:MAG: glycosyl transferase, partial [Gemmatimonadaceae bacterium]